MAGGAVALPCHANIHDALDYHTPSHGTASQPHPQPWRVKAEA
jgi:hypothetical protein